MKDFQVEALRDLAIEHLPKAQEQRQQAGMFGSQEQYYGMLSVVAMNTLAGPATTAVERLAARLLQQVMVKLMGHGYEEIDEVIVEIACDLCSLTHKVIPWLTVPSPAAEPVAAVLALVDNEAPIVSGQLLTTKEAALALGFKPNTLHKWIMNQSGPIKPASKIGQRYYWRSDDIIALKNGT
jgi:hypothetical protein